MLHTLKPLLCYPCTTFSMDIAIATFTNILGGASDHWDISCVVHVAFPLPFRIPPKRISPCDRAIW